MYRSSRSLIICSRGWTNKSEQQNITSTVLTLLSFGSGLTNHRISAQKKAMLVGCNTAKPVTMRVFLFLLGTFLIFSCNSKSQTVTPGEYREIGKFIWKTYVPKSGQAETVQGELLRAIEKLADEAQRNGNINFNTNCHGILVSYLRKYLTDTTIFDKETINIINSDLDTISKEDQPYVDDDLYDRLRFRIFDWYLKNKTPIRNVKNSKLHC